MAKNGGGEIGGKANRSGYGVMVFEIKCLNWQIFNRLSQSVASIYEGEGGGVDFFYCLKNPKQI